MSSDQQRHVGLAWQMPSTGTGTGENGSSGSPSSPASTSTSRRRGSEHDDGLLQHNVWQTHQDHQPHQQLLPATEDTSPATSNPPQSSPSRATIAIDVNPPTDAADSDPDSDFELVDSKTPLQIDALQIDRVIDRRVSPYRYLPTALRQQPVTRSTRARLQPQDQCDDDEDWPATAGVKNTMEGDNEYDQPEWYQAGPHADAQDLAGPGEHGLLQCTVTKPQKEGEGTQNLYVSYLVTTDVRVLPC